MPWLRSMTRARASRRWLRLTTTKKDAAGRSCPRFNPLAQLDADLFKSLMDGEHCLRGFTKRDIRSQLTKTRWLRWCAGCAGVLAALVC